jgi:MFS family permease
MGKPELLTPSADFQAQESSGAPATRVRYQVLALACTLGVIVYVHRVGFAVALPKIGLDADANGWIAAAFLLAYGGFEVPCGLLGDRLGVRHLLTVLVLGWSLLTGCAALVAFLPDVWALPVVFLVANRLLFGACQAGAFPSLSRMLTDWMPLRRRATAQGLMWMSTRLGAAAVPLIFGWLSLALGNWHSPLWILAALGGLWCLAFWPWFRNRPEEMARVNAAERGLIAAGRGEQPAGHGPIPWAKMLRSRRAWALCLMYGCGGFAANFYVTLLPDYLSNHSHLKLTDNATQWLTSAPFIAGLLACVGGGFLSDWLIRRTGNRKWGRRLQGTVATILAGAGWLMLNHAPAVWVLALLLCVIFFCNDLSMAPAWAACADIGERCAGTLGGAMNMIGNLTGAAGALVAGYLFRAHRADLVFAIYACSFWLATVCWLNVDVTKPLEEKHKE